MGKYRVDRANDIAELMDKVREAYDDAEARGIIPSTTESGFERVRQDKRKAFSPDPPAYRQKPVDVARQYTDNLIAAQYTNPEAFGRGRLGQHRVVVKSSEPDGHMGGRSPAGDRSPAWLSQSIQYDDAVRLIEDVARRAFNKAPTRLAQAAGPTPGRDAKPLHAAPRPVVRHPDDRFDTPPAPPTPPPAEVTSTNFHWQPGESAFEQYAAGAIIVSGEGAEFFDPERTQTFFGRPG